MKINEEKLKEVISILLHKVNDIASSHASYAAKDRDCYDSYGPPYVSDKEIEEVCDRIIEVFE